MQPVRGTIPFDPGASGGSGGDDGMWQQSVETRLSELRADVQGMRNEMSGEFRSVRDRQERDFRLLFGALIVASLGLAGILATGFGWIV
jgi:hypothetical protein